MFEDTYGALADAIILQAVEDYREKLDILKDNPKDRSAKYHTRAIETFFLSEWFDKLTNINGSELITKLRTEAA